MFVYVKHIIKMSDKYRFESSVSESDYSGSDSDEEYAGLNLNMCGFVLKNKHILLQKLGSGRFSIVWLSYNVLDSKFYAVKVHNVADGDEGNDEIFIQHVKLNPEGVFYVEKLVRMKK